MTEHFNVGEVAVIVNVPDQLSLNGHECTITGPFDRYMDRDMSGRVDGYLVRVDDGRIFAIVPRCLRKKRPPNDLSSWSRIWSITRWSPKRETA